MVAVAIYAWAGKAKTLRFDVVSETDLPKAAADRLSEAANALHCGVSDVELLSARVVRNRFYGMENV